MSSILLSLLSPYPSMCAASLSNPYITILLLLIGFFSLVKLSSIEVHISKIQQNRTNLRMNTAFYPLCDIQSIQQTILCLLTVHLTLISSLNCLHPEGVTQCLKKFSLDNLSLFSFFLSIYDF